jgi:hypothetical protein
VTTDGSACGLFAPWFRRGTSHVCPEDKQGQNGRVVTGVELLNKRVLLNGVELGRVVDVILDDTGERLVGFDVLCGDGSHRFLPYATALLGGNEVEVGSPLVLLGRDQLDFYRRHGRALRS